MCVVHREDWREHWAPKDRMCFYCAQYVDAPAVYWVGASDLLLHRDCAAELGVHLIADSREAQLAGGESPWAGRAAKAAGSALRAQEART